MRALVRGLLPVASRVLLVWRLRKPFATGGCCRTLAGVFRFAVFVACAGDRAGMTAASALLSPVGLPALGGARR